MPELRIVSTVDELRPEVRARSAADRLDSWKEISAYLRRGTRTLQRWERERGLPVHRLSPGDAGTVFAYRSELDTWMGRPAAPVQNAAPGPSVAVLAFADMSPARDQQCFCEGLVEEILNALARVPAVQVASRTSAFQFRNAPAGSREIGRRLGVRTLVEGSVRQSGTRLRILVRLTDSETGFQLWALSYDRESTDVFALEQELAQDIANRLELTLTTTTGERPHRTPAPDCTPVQNR
jgi:TolB-like protein